MPRSLHHNQYINRFKIMMHSLNDSCHKLPINRNEKAFKLKIIKMGSQKHQPCLDMRNSVAQNPNSDICLLSGFPCMIRQLKVNADIPYTIFFLGLKILINDLIIRHHL